MCLLFLKQKQKKNFIKKLFDSQKSAFKSFKTKTLNKNIFIFFFCFSFKNDRLTNVVLVSIIQNAQKKLITAKNGQKGVYDS